ncbi:MAG: hypothetical protein ABEL76_04880, partial [Bradymonadaceae bacterium]
MSDWSVERVARVTSAAVAVVCLGLVFWSYVSGTRVAAATVHEQRFEKTALKKPHMTFDLGEKTPVELTVRGPTLDDSWVWTKIVI